MVSPIRNNSPVGNDDSIPNWETYQMTDEEQMIWATSTMQQAENILFENRQEEEQNEETEFYNRLDNLINTKSKNELSPFGLHASLSGHKYPEARRRIKYFFEDPNERYAFFGSSSSDARSHNLFRCTNGKIYVVHSAYGDLDIFYLSKGELRQYFDEEPDEMPDFDDPQEVLDLLGEIDSRCENFEVNNEEEQTQEDISSQQSTPRRIIG